MKLAPDSETKAIEVQVFWRNLPARAPIIMQTRFELLMYPRDMTHRPTRYVQSYNPTSSSPNALPGRAACPRNDAACERKGLIFALGYGLKYAPPFARKT